MADEQNPFSSEYVSTSDPRPSPPSLLEKAEKEIQKEIVRYGSSKPKRVIVRAKVIDDKGS